jgi:hypothetical protein
MSRKRSRFARYDQKNPATEDYVIAGVGILIAAGVGYWIYSQSSTNAVAAAVPAATLAEAQALVPQGQAPSTQRASNPTPDPSPVGASGAESAFNYAEQGELG